MSNITLREKMHLAGWYVFDRMKTGLRNLKLSDPKAWNPLLWNLYGLARTESGINVTEENADTMSAVYNAINVISGTIATLPLHLYKKQSDGKRKVITNHPSLYCLKIKANHLMPAINFRECTTAHILAWGNMYAEKAYNSFGQLEELWPITPDRVIPEFKNGDLYYRIKVGGNEITLTRDKILHIAGLGYDGLRGYSVIRKAAESIGVSLAAEKFGARYFGANTNIGGALKYPRALGEDAKKNLRTSLEDYTGGKHSHRWMILEQGMEIEKLGFQPEESQFIQTRQFQIGEVARWFNLPPHKLKDLTRSTFSNIEEQEIEFVTNCIRPWLERIEQNYNIQLLTEKENKLGYYFKHSVEGLLRGASQARADYYTKLFYLGAIKPNEIRQLEDMDGLDSDNADKTYIQMNLLPLDEIDQSMPQNKNLPGEQPPGPEEPQPEENALDWAKRNIKLLEYRNITARDKISKRYYPMIKHAAEQLVFRESNLVEKLLRNKNSSRANAGNLKAELEDAYDGFKSYITRKMEPVFRAYADSIWNQALLEIGESVEEMPSDIILEINRYIDVFGKRHISSSQGQLNKLIDENLEDFETLIKERIEEWKEKRARKIANDESVRLSSFMAETAFFSFGYRSYWRARGPQTCPYCLALDGKAIKDGQSFFDGGEEHEPKGATNGPMLIRSTVKHPPLHQGCDCYISVR